MEFIVVLILSSLLCICNGNVFGPSTQSSCEADIKETRYIQSNINVLKDNMHELLKRVIKNENEISSLKSENQFLTNVIENERSHFSCDINMLHENINEQQQTLTDTNMEIYHLNETIEELRNDVDKLEELQGRISGENITECIDKSVKRPTDCGDLDKSTCKSGIYKICPDKNSCFKAFCEMKKHGGGWTVFQRRMNGETNFYREWNAYKQGFGDQSLEFWLGNDHLHLLTSQGQYRLRIDLEDFENNRSYALYDYFSVGSESSGYIVSVSDYSGDAGDSMAFQNGQKFSTKDKDNDKSGQDCAVVYKGAWWYSACHQSNLNGLYLKGNHDSFADGVNWKTWKGFYYSLKETTMMIRKF